MWFVSPLWLLGIVPWLGLVIWLLNPSRPRVDVSFIDLWRGPTLSAPRRRGWQVPPIPICLLLLAILVAIIAAADPVFRRWSARRGSLTIIVDRGLTMSATTAGEFRFRSALSALADRLEQSSSPDAIRLVPVPAASEIYTTTAKLKFAARNIDPSYRDSTAEVRLTVARERARFAAVPIIAVTDKPLESPGLTVWPPTGGVEDIGIAAIAARQTSSPQLMLRVLNQSEQSKVNVRIRSADQVLTREFALPSRGVAENYFIDLPTLGDTVEAHLATRDEFAIDDDAWLVRETAWPRVEARQSFEPPIEKILRIYSRQKPPSVDSVRVAVVARPFELSGTQPGIILSTQAGAVAVRPSVQVMAHPITGTINWSAMPLPTEASDVPGEGWRRLVQVDGHPLLAVREQPSRQVWVGFNTLPWSSAAEFVIFWSNMLDWVGGGREQYVSHPLEELTDATETGIASSLQPATRSFGPGLYRQRGALRAFNVWAPKFDIPPPVPLSVQLRSEADPTMIRIARRVCLLTALSLVAIATAFWPAGLLHRRLKGGAGSVAS